MARYSHNGPLRILQSLYPEGGEVCHNVLVHPTSGLVGGGTLDMRVTVGSGAHGLVTTAELMTWDITALGSPHPQPTKLDVCGCILLPIAVF